MLTCGHCFCNECIAIIIQQYSVGTRRSSIKCAICRQTTSHKEISYVFTAEAANQEDDIPVKVSCLQEPKLSAVHISCVLLHTAFRQTSVLDTVL